MLLDAANYTWNWESVYTPAIEFAIIVFFIILMIFFYTKHRIVPILFLILIISVFIGYSSIEANSIPFSPHVQFFFILFQTTMFLVSVYDYYALQNKVKSKSNKHDVLS